MKKWLPYLLLAAGIGVFYYLQYRTVPDIDFGKLQAKNISGQPVNMASMLSENAVVHFYATWCGPCMAEAREIRENYEAIKASGIQIIFVTDDSPEKTENFASYMPADIQFVLVSSLNDIGIKSIPTSYFLHQGNITKKIINPVNWQDTTTLKNLFIQ